MTPINLLWTFVNAWISPFAAEPLFAQRINDLGRRFRHGGSTTDATQVIILVVVVAALIAGVMLLARLVNSKRPCNNPKILFRELCRVHGLTWSDRRLLARVAACNGIEQPSAVFVKPDLLDPSTLHPRLEKRRDRISELRDRILGG